MTAARTFPGPDRRALRVVAIVLTAFIAGLAVAGQFGRNHARRTPIQADRQPRPASGAGVTTAPGPADRTDGIPSGFARTREGAVAAAAAFVTTGQALLDMDPLAASEAVRRMAAAVTADAQVDDVLKRLAAARETLATGSGPVVYWQATLAWRVDGYTPERARVAVWNVGVLSREGVAPPQAGWAVSSFDLVWERGDWRIWAETITPGPAPLPDDSAAPATSAQLAAALDGFTDFGAGS